MKAIRLRTEYLNNPVGIDLQQPSLQWNVMGGIRQTACRIVTEDWDSGKVLTSSMHMTYPLPLTSRQQVNWRVQVWDERDRPGEWSEGFFEMGLLKADDWQGRWITGDYKVDPKKRYPADCFRKRFVLSKKVMQARLYITACGLYEARLGGQKVGDFCLAPGYTDYRKRVQYQTYDVTDLLQPGENVLTVFLADGWYRGSCGAWGLKNQYGTETKLMAQLELTWADGSKECIGTDDSWEWSDDGPIRFADNKDGERIEAFRQPTYHGRAKCTKHSVIPSASNNAAVKEHECFTPVVLTTPSGKKVLDFRQNMQGYLSFELTAHRGQRILLRFGELIDRDGEFTQKNIQCSNKKITTPLQQVEYICAEGQNTYKTTFAVFGFQYVLVETDVEWIPENFTAHAVYSDLEQTAFFTSSHPLLNSLFAATLWSAKGNHLEIPTDCPTRERHGWTGDAQIFCRTAAYLFDYAPFARKYVRDLVDVQHRNGCFTQIAPLGGVDPYMSPMDGSAGWSDAGVLIPRIMYEMYGDRRILEENYQAMRRYGLYKLHCLGRWYPTSLPTGVGLRNWRNICNYGQSYGEWAEPVDVNKFRIADFVWPHPEETTAYLVYVMRKLAGISHLLGREEDRKVFRKAAAKATRGYRALVETKDHSLDTDRQAKLVRPLYMRLLDEEQTDFARKRLIRALENYGWRLGTGFLSTPLILYVLADIDPVYAYRLLENEEIPGWLSMPKHGATTIWESWEGPLKQTEGPIPSITILRGQSLSGSFRKCAGSSRQEKIISGSVLLRAAA